MKLKKVIAALSAVTMLGSSITALADKALTDENPAYVSIVSHDFTVNNVTTTISEAREFAVPDASQVWKDSFNISANADTKYTVDLYYEIAGNAATDTKNGMYYQITNTNQGTGATGKQVNVGTYKKTWTDVIPTSDTITLSIFNRGFGDGATNYAGWVITPTAYKVTLADGITSEDLDENGYAAAGSEITYYVGGIPTIVTVTEPLTISLPVASIGNTLYSTLTDAVAASVDGDTINLLSNATISGSSDRIIIDSNAKKSITINGNGYVVDNSTTGALFEVNQGSTVNFSNITVSKLEFKTSAVINADNLTVTSLKLGGNNATSKGTIMNSTIESLETYGRITLENTTVSTITVSDIATTSNQPQINADENSSLGTATVTKISEGVTLPYTLFVGTLPTSVTVPEGYVYADGQITAATVEPDTYDTDYFEFTATADKLATFTAIKLNATIDGVTLDSEPEDLSTVLTLDANADGVFYINVTDVPVGVTINSITLE